MSKLNDELENILNMIKEAEEGETWYIDDRFRFDVVDGMYDLIVCDYNLFTLSKKQLLAAAKEIYKTGTYKNTEEILDKFFR